MFCSVVVRKMPVYVRKMVVLYVGFSSGVLPFNPLIISVKYPAV